MQNKSFFILMLVLTLFSACKKTLPEWDKEADLVTDTSLFISSATYLSHTPSTCTYLVDVVQMNNLASEQTYSDVQLIGSSTNEFIYSISNVSVVPQVVSPNYTSVFLFEAQGYQLFAHGQASFFLSRYFELIEGKHPNQQIAFATYQSPDNPDLKFHKEGTSLFTNSAQFNDSLMNQIIRETDYTGYFSADGTSFRDYLFEAMDSLILNPEVTGQKSITLIDDQINNGQGIYAWDLIDEIVAKALLNDIQINVIYFGGPQYLHLATKTGGFIFDDRQANKVNAEFWDYDISAIGNNMASLDRILQNDYTVNRFEITVDNQGQFLYEPGANVRIDFQFNDDLFKLDLILP